MVDMTTISTAITGLNFVRDAVQVILQSKIEFETQKRVGEALDKLGTAQDALYQLREELFRLQEENAQVRRDLAARDNWDAEKAAYRLEQTAGGATVYAYHPEKRSGGAVVFEEGGPPQHFACPACFTKKTIQILQNRGTMGGGFDCPSCKVIYPVNPRQEMPGMRGGSVSDYLTGSVTQRP
jgi:hypothetical protein